MAWHSPSDDPADYLRMMSWGEETATTLRGTSGSVGSGVKRESGDHQGLGSGSRATAAWTPVGQLSLFKLGLGIVSACADAGRWPGKRAAASHVG